MTQKTDRLTRVEDGVKEIDRKITAMFDKMDKLCDLEDGPIAKQGRKLVKHDTLLGIIAGGLGAVVIAIIIQFFRLSH
jgi:hypothetical protein